MTDYRCPSCDGGFPESHDDGCPWCGEAMDGENTSGTELQATASGRPLFDRSTTSSPVNDAGTSIRRRSREPSIENVDNPLTEVRWQEGRSPEVTDCE